jgi:DNA polymerase III delta prime subunit
MQASESNEHVESYLRYYCDPKKKFDFAVLVSGPWGVGKTTLMTRLIDETTTLAKREDRPFKALRVSLYGVTSVQQIDDELFRQLHPVLASKGMKIGWNILKGTLKTAIKIDIDSKDELKLDAGLPDINLSEYFKTPSDALLIFDDLERCSMPVADVLGYINTFVEHNSFKTILIANEAEILRREAANNAESEGKKKDSDAANKYTLIKEKLIGQTLEVRSSAPDALSSFLGDIQEGPVATFLKASKTRILDLYAGSCTENLRLLKHSLLDYERIATNLTPEHWQNENAMKTLLEILLLLSIEARAGRLTRDQFPSLAASELVRRLSSKNSKGEYSVADQLAQKYPTVSVDKSPLELKQVERLLFEGWTNRTDVRRSLDESSYFSRAKQPAWMIAWRGWDVSDQDFADAFKTIESLFSECKFDSIYEMLHIFGLRLFFSKIGALKNSQEEIATECIACLDKQFAKDRLDEVDLDELFRSGGIYCLGHQVTSGDTKEFQTIFSHFEHLIGLARERRLPQQGQALLDLLKKDPVLFFQSLCVNNVRAAEFYNVPILATIPFDRFATELLSLEPTAQGTVFTTLKERFRSDIKELRSESAWLRSLNAELLRRAPTLTAISRYRLQERLKVFEPILERIEEGTVSPSKESPTEQELYDLPPKKWTGLSCF